MYQVINKFVKHLANFQQIYNKSISKKREDT